MMNDVVKMLYDNWEDNRIVNRNYKRARKVLKQALKRESSLL